MDILPDASLRWHDNNIKKEHIYIPACHVSVGWHPVIKGNMDNVFAERSRGIYCL